MVYIGYTLMRRTKPQDILYSLNLRVGGLFFCTKHLMHYGGVETSDFID